jgi:Fe-S cluster assembly protein SufD
MNDFDLSSKDAFIPRRLGEARYDSPVKLSREIGDFQSNYVQDDEPSTAEVDTKPELEIYADQVICSHGATVGELSEEQLFYLRARGIDEQTARGILTTAFADTIVERFDHEDFRERVRAAVHARLPRRIEAG